MLKYTKQFESSMKATSGHLIFGDGVDYKDLERVFPELFTTFLEETNQVPDDNDILQMFLYANMQEIARNEKPEGYNRKGRMRLIFPIGKKEFYIKSYTSNVETVRLTEKISKLLLREGVQHTVEWDQLITKSKK